MSDRGASPLRPVALVVLLVALLVGALLLVPRDAERLQEEVEAAGVLAPLAFVAAGALLTVCFFPFPIVAAAAGLLFGIAAGAALAVTAETIGACTALLLGRGGAQGWVRRRAGPRLTRLLQGVARRGFAAVLLVRVLPGVPRHPANYVFGLTSVPLAVFAAATVLGTAPRALAYAALGGSLGDLDSPESIAAVAGLAVVGALGLWLGARDPELRAVLAERRKRRQGGSAG